MSTSKTDINDNILKASFLAHSTHQYLERMYSFHLSEYKVWSRITPIVSILGFLVILIGTVLVLSGHKSLGILTGISGLVTNGVSILFFKQKRVIMGQLEHYLDRLLALKCQEDSIRLIESMSEEKKPKEIKKIIRNILVLSKDMHSSSSICFPKKKKK